MAHAIPTLLRASTFAILGLLAASITGCDKGAPPTAQAAAPPAQSASGPVVGRLVEISATAEGYSPATIDAKAGEQLTLRVTRKTKSECLGEIMIPSMNIKKTLPENTPVDIPITIEKAGDIKFSCGMGMVFGKISAS